MAELKKNPINLKITTQNKNGDSIKRSISKVSPAISNDDVTVAAQAITGLLDGEKLSGLRMSMNQDLTF